MAKLIEFKHWQQAVRLLQFQIDRMEKGNKHFRTLSMFLYRVFLKKNTFVSTEEFFDTYIKSNLYFAMTKEFAVFKYGIPKGKLGNRNYRMLSVPLRLAHYAYGIYILDLTQEFLDETVRKRKRIKAFYGGELRLNARELILKADRVWFFDSYKRFQRSLKHSIKKTPGSRKVVFSFDVAAFYDRLSIQHLLRELEQVIPSSAKAYLNFTGRHPMEITEFYRYIMDGVGIPQSDNDVISDFLGFLFLSLVDLSLEDLLQKFLSGQNFSIVRYVDDYYVVVDLPENLNTAEVGKLAKKMAEKISDLFHDRWQLSLNDKASVFDCTDQTDFRSLTDKIKRVSNPFSYVEIDDDDDGILERAALLLDLLAELKESPPRALLEVTSANSEALKDVFSEQIQAALKKVEFQGRLKDICTDLDFDLIKSCAKEFTCLFHLHAEVWENYIQHLIKSEDETGRDANLMVLALCQSEFKEQRLIDRLSTSVHFRKILEAMRDFDIDPDKISYFNLDKNQISKVLGCWHLIHQARRRSFACRDSNLSLAINHLCTELVELLKYYNEKKARNGNKNLTSKDVLDWMSELDCSNEDTIVIKNLFDRRNNNGISHASLGDSVYEEIYETEYRLFLKSAEKLFHQALSKI